LVPLSVALADLHALNHILRMGSLERLREVLPDNGFGLCSGTGGRWGLGRR